MAATIVHSNLEVFGTQKMTVVRKNVLLIDPVCMVKVLATQAWIVSVEARFMFVPVLVLTETYFLWQNIQRSQSHMDLFWVLQNRDIHGITHSTSHKGHPKHLKIAEESF